MGPAKTRSSRQTNHRRTLRLGKPWRSFLTPARSKRSVYPTSASRLWKSSCRRPKSFRLQTRFGELEIRQVNALLLTITMSTSFIYGSSNKVQLHPCLPSSDLLAYCAEKGIHVTGYSPLGRKDSPFFSDDTIKSISEKHEITIAQVLLSWGVQRGTSVIPKSVQEERLKSNFTVRNKLAFPLTES